MATTTETPPTAADVPKVSDRDISHRGSIRVAMRWKLLGAFASAFTIVFVFIAFWVVDFSTGNAESRLVEQLNGITIGGAATIRTQEFELLITTVPAVPDPTNPYGVGYPDSPLYVNSAKQLQQIREIVAEANPYTYFRDPGDGQLYFATSAGYFLDPPFGVTYRVPVADVASPETYARMERGLTETVNEPAYTDPYGSWISAYSPIKDDTGRVVGALGIDYPLTYVDDVRLGVRNEVLPVLLGSYFVLLLMVLLLSSTLVRPLRRLTAATRRIAAGEYNLDVRSLVRSRFPDEMYELGESFEQMAIKVGAREKSLTQEVQRLRVEIDQSKREEAVKEITETDFFSDLAAQASKMRARMRLDEDHPESDAHPKPEDGMDPS